VKYRIVWKHKTTGSKGKGTKHFTQAEAQMLVQELNADYPLIEHWLEAVE
jgi:hypothetical protein